MRGRVSSGVAFNTVSVTPTSGSLQKETVVKKSVIEKVIAQFDDEIELLEQLKARLIAAQARTMPMPRTRKPKVPKPVEVPKAG